MEKEHKGRITNWSKQECDEGLGYRIVGKFLDHQDYAGQGMSEALSAKARVRKVLRTYMETPGATMETDVFVAMTKLVEDAEQAARRSAIERAARMADKFEEVSIEMHAQGHADHARNIATAIRNLAHKEEG